MLHLSDLIFFFDRRTMVGSSKGWAFAVMALSVPYSVKGPYEW